jgi:transcription elongation factor GreB
MEIVSPLNQVQDRIYFGAHVTVLENGENRRYQLVGVDEAEAETGKISWLSPLATVLRGARVGDKRMMDLPSGLVRLEVRSIDYLTDE